MKGVCAERCGHGKKGMGGGRGLGKGPKGSKLDFDKMAIKFLGKRIFNDLMSFPEIKSQKSQTIPNT